MAYGIGRMCKGDTLYVKAGTYSEGLYISGKHGSADREIHVKAYPGHEVVIRGRGVHTGRVKIADSSHLTLSGFKVTNLNQGLWLERSHDVIIRNCEVHHIGQNAIYVGKDSEYITIENCSIHDTGKHKYNGEGIYIGTGSRGPKDNTNHVTVRNNVIFNILDEAVELKPGTHDCLVEGNSIHDVRTGPSYGAVEVNEATLGFQQWPATPNHIVRNNMIHDTDTSIRAGTGCLVYNNVIYQVRHGSYGILANNRASDSYTRRIYHNTIDLPGSRAVHADEAKADIRNNIGPPSAGNLPAMSEYFVSTVRGSENYRLVENAAPVDAGGDIMDTVQVDMDGKSRDRGAAPDIGAYEY